MRSFSDLLHRTPWWGLLGGGFALFVCLVVFVTPFHLLRLEHSGATPEENRAIKREIDSTFSEGAIDMARGVVREMRNRTKDPARRDELDRALEEIDQARASMREAGADALRAKREAAQTAASAVKDAANAIREARREAAQARKDAGVEARVQKSVEESVQKSLEESLKAAEKAQEEATQAEKSAVVPPPPPGPSKPPGKRGPLVIELDGLEAVAPPTPPLPPEMRAQIRKNVTSDLYRIGVGTALILIFIPLFILAVVSKIFIDRSRAAQQMAELKRREAEYHRMSQQVTEAKLSALQAQVEPHFLYNTLASVQALTEVDPQQANAMTGHLIQYLRNALPKMRASVSTVGQEVELVRAYLNILQMRMGERLAFEIELPPELADAPFPPLMLPSLVENAIKHGLEPQREGGTVVITAAVVDGKLRVTVADTGRGFGATQGQGVGLANIRERLAALYGDAGTLTLEANAPHGVRATIQVPRDGARSAAAGPAPFAPPKAAAPTGAAARTLAAMGAAERAWRKGLSFAFVVLVVCAAVLAGLAIVAVAAGALPVHMGNRELGGATGALLGTAGIAAAFVAAVLALAIVLAIVYGLGFLFVGLALFIPLVILVSLFPVLAPFILVGLVIWWLIRRNARETPKETPAPPPGTP